MARLLLKYIMLVFIFLSTIAFPSCIYLCSGSYCFTENYRFYNERNLVSRIKYIKGKNIQYDVMRKDSSGYISMDDFSPEQHSLGTFYVFDTVSKCAVYCEAHNGNIVSILSYVFPKCTADSSAGKESCDGMKKDFFTMVHYVYYDKRKESKERDIAKSCAEDFFKLIGPYEIIE